MSRWKLYCSAAVFIIVTVLKLLLPDTTEQLREDVVALIDMDMDYRQIAVQVGSILSEDSLQQVLSLFTEEAVEVVASPNPTAAPSPSPTPPPTATPSPTPCPDESVIKAVAAFHRSQEAYAEYPTPATVSYSLLVIPFDYTAPVSGVTSSGFGYRVHPLENEVRFHYGTDYAVSTGTPIAAFADGEVTMTGYEKGYGNYVQVTHADGWKTLYAHCSDVKVTWGQWVKKGETIALSGQTGETTGPHLHLELTCNGYYTNPEFFF